MNCAGLVAPLSTSVIAAKWPILVQ